MFEREFDFHEHKAAVLLEMAAKGPFHHTSEKVQERALFDVMQSFEHYHKTKHHLVGGPPATTAVAISSINGAWSPPGTAMAIGLVATVTSRVPG